MMSFSIFDFIPTTAPVSVPEPALPNTVITPEWEAAIGEGRSPLQIAEANLKTLRLLVDLAGQEPRLLSDEKRLALLAYRGWGAVPELFLEDTSTLSPRWLELGAEVRQMILVLAGEAGYEASRHSVLTAFYTTPWMIRGLYRLLERFGVRQSGRLLKVLEPGCGTGLFLGLAPQHWPLQWTAVEPDPIAARIVQVLYPNAEVQQCGLEEANLPIDYYDLAVGNVPFMQAVPHDRAFATWQFGGLHDYCIAKTVAALKPGGIAALFTSLGSLQSKRSQEFRDRLAAQTRLITAIKLPMLSFWTFNRTQVGADLLVLQKLFPKQQGNSRNWTELVEMDGFSDPETEQPLSVNRWFIEQPQTVIGEWVLDRNVHQSRITTTLPDNSPPVEALFEKALALVDTEGVNVAGEGNEGDAGGRGRTEAQPVRGSRHRRREDIAIPSQLRDDPHCLLQPNSYVIWEGLPWQVRNGRLWPVEKGSASRKRRVIGMCRIKVALHRVLEMQRQGCSDLDLAQAQTSLNRYYDLFVRDYGWLHTAGNMSAFGDDPDFPLLLSLEVWDADRPRETSKAAIFTQRTLYIEPPRQAPQTAKEALVYSLADRGCVDLDYIAQQYGRSVETVLAELAQAPSPLVFHDPETQKWVTAEEYLSGLVKLKLEQARSAVLEDERYQVNVQALEAVQPQDLLPNQIYVQLGSAWLPKTTVAQFVAHLLDLQPEQVVVRHNRVLNAWDLDTVIAPPHQVNVARWGTQRITALRLIELALNQQAPVIYDPVWNANRKDYDPVKNHEETRRALNRSVRIKQAFKRWVWTDAERTYELTRIYNQQFNSSRSRRYNGSHLRCNLTGMSRLWQERLVNPTYHYQLDLVWRILCQGNTLGQIPVGGGKTAIMVVASQLLRQFGRCTKPAMVVPDHLVLQQAAEALSIYPGLRVLLIASELMPTPQKRREIINRCASGNWDLIICSQTALTSIPMHPDTVARFQKAEFEVLMAGWRESYGGDTGSKRGLKDEERAVERYTAKVKARHERMQRTAVAYFDHSGIDWLLVDESHDYLGLPTDTRMTGVLGLSSSSSQRAQDLRYKAQFLAGLRGAGQGLGLMSGTPIRNTLGQAWVNLVYLMPQVLESQNLLHFDSFISVFAEAVTQTEVTGAGTLDVKTRLASWSNLPEFRLLWRQVAHIIREDHLQIVRPKPVYKTVEVPATPSQIQFFHWLASRVSRIKQRSGRPQKGDDNWCAVCTDTTMGVIDPRLLRLSSLKPFLNQEQIAGLDQEYSKVERCIDDTYESWADPTNTELRRVQLIFCDAGTPHRSDRWTVYHHFKAQLMARGVPEAEIAFIHDAKQDRAKAELFERVRQGKVRVLIASTAKLGVGTQIPDRLYQLRHLDCPKRPTDIWQRNGRIVRPGNLHEEVEIYFYVTTGKPVQVTDKEGKNTTVQGISPDSWLYEMVRRKASFIDAGVNSDDSEVRMIEDIDEVTLDFATLMAAASGDRRLIEKMNLDRQVQALLDLESDYQVRRSIAQRQVTLIPDTIERLQRQIQKMEQDLKMALSQEEKPLALRWGVTGDNVVPTILHDPKQIGKKLLTWVLMAGETKQPVDEPLGRYGEFELRGYRIWASSIMLVLVSQSGVSYSIPAKKRAHLNVDAIRQMSAVVKSQIESFQWQIQEAKQDLIASQQMLEQPFTEAEELQVLLEQQAKLAEELGLLDVEVAG